MVWTIPPSRLADPANYRDAALPDDDILQSSPSAFPRTIGHKMTFLHVICEESDFKVSELRASISESRIYAAAAAGIRRQNSK